MTTEPTASADALLTSRVEILFPLPMKLPDDFDRRLVDLLNEVCDAYEDAHPDRVMWPSGFGSAPKWSKRDAEFLGIAAAADAPETGEPSFDDSTFQISITEREAYPEDIAARAKRKARTAANASDDDCPKCGHPKHEHELDCECDERYAPATPHAVEPTEAVMLDLVKRAAFFGWQHADWDWANVEIGCEEASPTFPFRQLERARQRPKS